jgi:hypothetical protein
VQDGISGLQLARAAGDAFFEMAALLLSRGAKEEVHPNSMLTINPCHRVPVQRKLCTSADVKSFLNVIFLHLRMLAIPFYTPFTHHLGRYEPTGRKLTAKLVRDEPFQYSPNATWS